ncbi:hypothetical protein ACU4GH_10635 [Bradyrhizobium betae]|uniref:hypothetical protein n=1 Tax=Bradyrhizobium betae TaxID=244734 RepID=UPI003D67547D
MFDLRIVAIAASFILASIAVAAAERAPDQSAQPVRTESADQARPIRVILPAPWQAASPSATSQAELRK